MTRSTTDLTQHYRSYRELPLAAKPETGPAPSDAVAVEAAF